MLFNVLILNILLHLILTGLPAKAAASCKQFSEKSFEKVEILQHSKDFQEFQNEAIRRGQAVLGDPSFQEWVTKLQRKSTDSLEAPKCSQERQEGELYIFVSFSLGEKALLNLAYDAKRFGATLVLRGFFQGSYRLTAQKLHKIIQETEQGVIVDPELFSLFSISVVPTFILTKPFRLHAEAISFTPLHDRLQGHVSVQYVLETFAREGDLKREAQGLLEEKKLLQGGRK